MANATLSSVECSPSDNKCGVVLTVGHNHAVLSHTHTHTHTPHTDNQQNFLKFLTKQYRILQLAYTQTTAIKSNLHTLHIYILHYVYTHIIHIYKEVLTLVGVPPGVSCSEVS